MTANTGTLIRRGPGVRTWIGTNMSRIRLLVSVVPVVFVLSCVDSLPVQDLRILEATPAAKVSADILWEEYQADPAAADSRYWGRAVEVTGTVTSADSDTVDAYVLFGQTETFGVRADVLDEQAAAVIAAVKLGEKLTLKCFCAGLDGHVRLKSCMLPGPPGG